MVSLVLIVYIRGKRSQNPPLNPGSSSRFARFGFKAKPSGRGPTNPNRPRQYDDFSGNYAGKGTFPWTPPAGEESSWPLSVLYRRIGKKQKVAGVGFVIASVFFLVLAVLLKSVVLEIDSVVSFAVAAILFLKESRNRVQSKVLGAIILSLGTTIAGLSSKAGSSFYYSPFGKEISDVAVVGSPENMPTERQEDSFKVVPPGMGLATLFAREAEAGSITAETLSYLLPSVIRENFGLAEAVDVMTTEGRVEVVLRNPPALCSCQSEESRSTGVVGCTVSSFLAVLYTFASQGAVYLDRCSTDNESRTWRVSMSLQTRPT
jgi:hypothetical protein